MMPILSPRSALATFGWLVLASGLAACGGGGPQGDPAAPVSGSDEPPVAAAVGDAPADAPEAEEEQAAEAEEPSEPSFLSEQNRRAITLFFQDPNSDLLMPEERQIFETNSLTDQAKQIVVGLIDGPQNPNLLPTMPEKTRVLGLYMDRYGTAWVDLSHEVVSDHLGGTAEELATIFSLVNSITVSLPDIKRVHILVDGEERDTLKSHLDLRRDFIQNLSIVHGNDE
jgi:germination protein M